MLLFESFNSIHNWCDRYDITNYTINDDGSIDVNGNVNLFNTNISELPISFNKVSGDFSCESSRLTDLKGSPEKIGGYFHCGYNESQRSLANSIGTRYQSGPQQRRRNSNFFIDQT